jgi:DNA-binding MarR family transcriptional regulator
MTQEAKALFRLITQIRRAFQDLATTGDALHADLGIPASRRALLEFLHDHGSDTVANIARAKNVTRQHIQQIADQAVAAGLVEFAANPAHKRSQLVRLTRNGSQIFTEIRQRENTLLAHLGKDFRHDDLVAANATLARLRETLAGLNRPERETSEPERTLK